MPVAGLVVRLLRSLFCKIKGKKEKGGGFSRVYANDAGAYPASYRLKTKSNPGKTTFRRDNEGGAPSEQYNPKRLLFMRKKLKQAALLWLLAVVAVLAGAWCLEGSWPLTFPTGAKLGASVLLVFWAFWANHLLGNRHALGRSTTWVAAGMLLGFCGDVVMQRIFFEQHAVLVAIGIFGLGHLAYLLAFVRMTPTQADEKLPLKIAAVAPVLGLALWWFFVYSDRMGPVLLVGSLIYSFLIVAMAAGAFFLWRRNPGYGVAFLGSISFVVSDVLLGNQLFRSPAFAAVGLVIFTTYILGQWAIVSAVPLAFKEPRLRNI